MGGYNFTMEVFGKHDDEKRYGAVFDIGSGSIGTAVVACEKRSAPILYYTSRLDLKLEPDSSRDKFVTHLLSSLDRERVRLEDDVLKHIPGKIDHALCIISTPWYIYQTREIKIQQEKPVKVSRSFIKKIIKEFRDEFHTSRERSIVQEKLGTPEIIEEHVLGTLLNGYPIEDPFGKTVKRLDIAILMSMMSKEMKNSIKSVLEKSFARQDIIFHSSALAIFSTVRALFHEESNFLLVNVTSQVTDISIVLDGVIVETTSFAVGYSTIVRKLSTELNTSSSAALSLLNMSVAGVTNSKRDTDTTGSIAASKEAWLTPFRIALADMSENRVLPLRTFLITDREIGRWFKNIVEEDSFVHGVSSAKMTTLTVIDDLVLDKHFVLGKHVTPDVMLTISSLFDCNLVNPL
jgi:hypothetical protein